MFQKVKPTLSPDKAMSLALMRGANLHRVQDARAAAIRLDVLPLPNMRSNKPIVREILDLLRP